MATRKASPITPLDALFNASVNAAKSDDMLRQTFVNAGGDQDEPKRILMAGRVAHYLDRTREQALAVMAKKGRGKNPDSKDADAHDLGDDVRTVREEKACGAARVFLSGRLKAWGLKTTEGRGGDRTGARNLMAAEKLVLPKAPKVETSVELGAWAMAFSKSGYDFFLLNKAHKAVSTALGSKLMGLFADFQADVAAEIEASNSK